MAWPLPWLGDPVMVVCSASNRLQTSIRKVFHFTWSRDGEEEEERELRLCHLVKRFINFISRSLDRITRTFITCESSWCAVQHANTAGEEEENGISRLHRYACNVRRLQLQQLSWGNLVRQAMATTIRAINAWRKHLAPWPIAGPVPRPLSVCLEAAAVPRVECVQWRCPAADKQQNELCLPLDDVSLAFVLLLELCLKLGRCRPYQLTKIIDRQQSEATQEREIPISHWARVIKFRMKRDCDWETDSPQLGVNAATFQLSPDRVSIPRPDHSLSLGTCVQEFSANSRRDFNQLAETDSNSSSLSLWLPLRLPLGTADTFAVCAAHIFTVMHFPSAFSSHVVSQLATLLKLTARQIIKTQQQQKKRTRNRKLRSV